MEELVAHNLEQQRTTDIDIKSLIPFNQMSLCAELQRGLKKSGFEYPTVLQASAISMGCAGLDLIVQAKSGTGKTLIFCTVLLNGYKPSVHKPQALVMSPTREIAVQVAQILNKMGKEQQGFQAMCAIGGMDVMSDRKRLQNARAVVGTPGRLLHLIKSGILNITGLTLLVLDEADKMLQSTIGEDVQRIIEHLPKKRQTICCSATFGNAQLYKELNQIMRNPLLISAEAAATALVGIKQFVYALDKHKNSVLEMHAKLKALNYIFSCIVFKQCLIFAGSQLRAETYCTQLKREGWACAFISAAQDQATRLHIFQLFREGKINVLIATDLMSRGVDLSKLNLVINLDIPDNLAVYMHRIGRAGRFGTHGIAVNVLASQKNYVNFKEIMQQSSCTMQILRFPPERANASLAEIRDFWDFGSLQADIEYYGLFDMLSMDSLSTVSSCGATNNSSQQQTDCSSQLDTNTFPVNQIDVVHLRMIEDASNDADVEEEEDEEEEEVAHLPSSNTIDDASSLLADECLSSTEGIADQELRQTFERIKPLLKQYLNDGEQCNKTCPKYIDFFAQYEKFNANLQLSE